MHRPISRRAVIAGGAALAARPARSETTRITVTAGEGRQVDVTIWPAEGPERGVIQFSHGALSRPEKYARLIAPWAASGFTVLAPLHTDSTDHPDHDTLKGTESWRYRLEDMRVLDALAGDRPCLAAGHSYGALVALTLGGAEGVRPDGLYGPLRAALAKAVVAFSPPGPVPVLMTEEGYAHLSMPALIQTGTEDNPAPELGGGDWHRHLIAFDAAPPGDTYGLVLDRVDHYFGNLICRPELPGPPQTECFDIAIRLSTDFLAAYGANNADARARLDAALTPSPLAALTRKTKPGQPARAPAPAGRDAGR